MYTEKLLDEILLKPALELGCNSLKIVTGYTDTEFISRHLIQLADLKSKTVSVDMILGMTGNSGLTQRKHDSIINLIKDIQTNSSMPEFYCRYKYQGSDIHSKVYVWYKDEKPFIAFCGSANYSTNAFMKRRECMTDCNSLEAEQYFLKLLPDTVLSTDSDIINKISFAKRKVVDSEFDEYNLENLNWTMFEKKEPLDTCKISLLQADGSETGLGSGINWGIRPNGQKRDRDEAYIPYNKADKKDGFFPLKINSEDKNNPLFKVVTKDFPPFFMRVAQQGNKGIHTATSNALLGKYLRQKLNILSGEIITKEMLENYGKTYVVFKKYENDIYVLDF